MYILKNIREHMYACIFFFIICLFFFFFSLSAYNKFRGLENWKKKRKGD